MEPDSRFKSTWESITPAPRMQPLKPGNYLCSVIEVKHAKAKTGTEGVEVSFRVEDGPNKGVLTVHRIWARGSALGDDAMAIARRDLELFGFTSFEQIDDPPPVDPTRRFTVTITRDDDNPMGKVYCFNAPV